MRSLFRSLKRPLVDTLQARQLHRRIQAAEKLRVVIGASGTEQAGWIATEQKLVDLLTPSTWGDFFEVGSVDAIMAEHVWEHLDVEQGKVAARTCFLFLRPGGYLRVAVPDGNHPSPDYIQRVRPGGSGDGADDHKVLYDHESFAATFRQAGFDVRLNEYFDEHGVFHGQDWDTSMGIVRRTLRFDQRNQQQRYGYTSLFLDAFKPAAKANSEGAAQTSAA